MALKTRKMVIVLKILNLVKMALDEDLQGVYLSPSMKFY